MASSNFYGSHGYRHQMLHLNCQHTDEGQVDTLQQWPKAQALKGIRPSPNITNFVEALVCKGLWVPIELVAENVLAVCIWQRSRRLIN